VDAKPRATKECGESYNQAKNKVRILKDMHTIRHTIILGLFFFMHCGFAKEEAASQPNTHADNMLRLSRLAIETNADQLSEKAYAAVRTAILDALGCALAGHAAPGVDSVLKLHLEWGGKPESTVWFHGGRLPAPAAAFVNSVQLHALDFDDYHPPSDTHISAVVLPVVLAVGESEGASGKDALAATILGIEVGGRLGRLFRAGRTNEGFLPSSVIGGFGATAAACRLKRLSAEQTAHALGLFYAHASGNRQALFDRALSKRLQPAIAAQAAVTAACLASHGITGAEHVLDGEAGLLRIYASAKKWSDARLNTAPPDGAFEVESLRFKKFACCGRGHGALQAAIALASEHDLKPETIEQIEIFGVGVNSGMVGVPWNPDHPVPQVLAQFCAPYEVAVAIRSRRMGAAEIDSERIRADREVSDLAAKRTHLRDPKEFGGTYPGAQTVRIRTRAGETLTASGLPNGWLKGEAAVVGKFHENAAASGRYPPQRAAALLEAIRNLSQNSDLARFVRTNLVFETMKGNLKP
jgi:2-methylcitrate dehydratase PrpD